MSTLKTPQTLQDFPTVLIQNVVSLATSGFGLVVALAWNEVIQQAITLYIDPLLGKGSGLLSLLVYAVIITTLAVVVIMQLTRVQNHLEQLYQRRLARKLERSSTSGR